MPNLNPALPTRDIQFTHKLKKRSYLISTSELRVFKPEIRQLLSLRTPPKTFTFVSNDINVKLVENYLGFTGKFSRVFIEKEDKEYYVLSQDLEELPEFTEKYKLLTPRSSYNPPYSSWSDKKEILDWDKKQFNKSLYDSATQSFFCCVETEFSEEELTESQIYNFSYQALLDGLKIIFKSNAKKYDYNYINEILETYYISAQVRQWTVKTRSCSNFYSLVIIPAKFLNSNEIVDYRYDREAAFRDGINNGLLKPGASADSITSSVTIDLLSWADFEQKINNLKSKLDIYGNYQQQYADSKADEYIPAFDSAESYMQEIELNILEESKKFIDSNNDGSFLNVMRRLLEINNVDITTVYQNPSENSIFFGFDSSHNIIYIDVVRNNQIQPLYVDGYIFDNDFGSYGVVSSRCGFLLERIVEIISLQLDLSLRTTDNDLLLENFITTFIIPPPKEINLQRRDIDCAKNVMQKLYQDGLIKGLQELQPLSELIEVNIRRARLRRNLQSEEMGALAGRVSSAEQAAAQRQPPEEDSWFKDEFMSTLKANGGDYSNGKRAGLTALNEMRKILVSTNFQRALIARIICIIKDMDNQSALESIDGFLRSDLKKEIEDALTRFFCTPFFEMLLKALSAFKVPRFKPLNTRKILKEAMGRALAQAIIEIYNYAVRWALEALANCGKDGNNAPEDEDLVNSLNDAINDALDNNDNPFANPDLGTAYDSAGVPNNNIQDDNSEAKKEAAKQQLKNLMADVSCILNIIELCRLLSEGNASEEVLSIIKSLLVRRYPELAQYLTTREQILNFFKKIGEFSKIGMFCANLKQQPIFTENCLCDAGDLDRNNREKLKNNNLSDDQIDAILADMKKNRKKRMDDLLDTMENNPQNIPLVCDPVSTPGSGLNVAQLDPTYMQKAKDTVQGSLDPVYEAFNEDLKEWSSNMCENSVFNFSTDEIRQIQEAAVEAQRAQTEEEKEAASNKLKLILIAKKIIVAEQELDDEGNPSFDMYGNPIYKEDDDGNIIYRENTDPTVMKSQPPTIAPVLIESLALPDYHEEDKNSITLKVRTDNERVKYEFLLSQSFDINENELIREIYARRIATLWATISVDITVAATDLIIAFTAGDLESDAGFWFGVSKIQKGDRKWYDWIKTIIAALAAIIKILDQFIAGTTGDVRNTDVTTQYLQGGYLGSLDPVRDTQARSAYARQNGYVQVEQFNNTYDGLRSTNGNGLGYVDNSYSAILDLSSRDMVLASMNQDNYYALNKEAVLSNATNSGQPYDTQRYSSEEAIRTAEGNLTEDERETYEEINNDRTVLTGERPMASTEVFNNINQTFSDIEAEFAFFQQSLTFKQIINLFNRMKEAVNGFQEEVQQIVQASEQARLQIQNLSSSFPNFDLKYSYGNNIDNLSTLEITKNNDQFITSSFEDKPDQDILDYIYENNLLDGYDSSKYLTPQEAVFKNLLKNLNIENAESVDFYAIQKQFMDSVYDHNIKSSADGNITPCVYRNVIDASTGSENISGSFTYKTNMTLLRNALKDRVTSEYDNQCGIKNSSLDLDEIIEDVLQDFANDNCNHAPPDPNGRQRDKMHPIENVTSNAFLLATIRVYLYDYYLKGVFLFDRYSLGMTATEPMIEFLSNCFEIEMRNFDNQYFLNFLDACEVYGKLKYDEYYRNEEERLSGDTINVIDIKRSMFKKIIKEELLYLSNRITGKFNSSPSISPESVEGRKYIVDINNKYGNVYKFFKIIRSEPSRYENTILKVTGDNPYWSINSDGTVTEQSSNYIILLNNQEIYSFRIDLGSNTFGWKTDPVYRTIFEYCFPIRKYISLGAMHTMLTSNARMQSVKTFLSTKALLKGRHNGLMNASGYESVNDASTAGPVSIGAGDIAATETFMMPIIIRTMIKVPIEILKQTCETGNLNVFLASLPYNIMKPITLAITNQIPMLPLNMHPAYGTSEGVPPKKQLDEDGMETLSSYLSRLGWFLPISGFTITPILGLIMSPWIKPGFPGIMYYLLLCWADEAIENTDFEAEVASAAAAAFAASGNATDVCQVARAKKAAYKQNIDRSILIDTEYA